MTDSEMEKLAASAEALHGEVQRLRANMRRIKLILPQMKESAEWQAMCVAVTHIDAEASMLWLMATEGGGDA